jgi:hypothetical protein
MRHDLESFKQVLAVAEDERVENDAKQINQLLAK